MKIADITVGTEYALSFYDLKRNAESVWLPRAERVAVLAIRPGGKVVLAPVTEEGEVGAPQRRTELARYLVMPWAEAVPRLAAIAGENARRRQWTRDRVRRLEDARASLLATFERVGANVPAALQREVTVYGDGSGVSGGDVRFYFDDLVTLLDLVEAQASGEADPDRTTDLDGERV